MCGRGSARGGQEGVLPRARTHYARTGPGLDAPRESPGQGVCLRSVLGSGMPLVTGRRQLTGSAKGQCSHMAH
ncbi:hypothetical protein SSBG_03978 [Streptomyces sp. SPB074]|nr:hypothetical protein SSBG_03978 [Streptomyces sp. SPB074]